MPLFALYFVFEKKYTQVKYEYTKNTYYKKRALVLKELQITFLTIPPISSPLIISEMQLPFKGSVVRGSLVWTVYINLGKFVYTSPQEIHTIKSLRIRRQTLAF